MTEPTESSIPPVIMTIACPIEKMPNNPMRFAVLATLIGERKSGLMIATTAPTTRIKTRRPTSFLYIEETSIDLAADRKPEYALFAKFRSIEKAADGPLMHYSNPVAYPYDLFHVA